MQSIAHEIASAAERLDLDPAAVVRLPAEDSERVYRAALKRFVGSDDRRWWWEAFKEPGVSLPFVAGDGWRKLPRIVPRPSEPVWFIAEDDQLPQYPVFEMSAEVASKIIGECYGFEYYLIAKDLSWLVCETHHNVICAVGAAVEYRLLEHAVQPVAPADGSAAR
ncbi:DUF6756 family protein [Roseateles sp. NT4]|uniref:DUF6756 family protein n=1 Tax=Roseateles sp. NT4 TaxID=3453715 RepID=UPI003EEE71A1